MIGVGIVGSGDISRRYVECLQSFEQFSVRGVASRNYSETGTIHSVPCTSLQSLLNDDQTDLIINLTPPLAHASVTEQALRAGNHVYSEKPLAHNLTAADELLALAAVCGQVLACAPATHLGPTQQMVRHMLRMGELGEVAGATATVVYSGPDRWHHNPAPLFGRAAGPLFDLGVYFVSAFVHWFGNARRVSAIGRKMQDTRQVHAGPRRGEVIHVEAPTHVTGWIEFESGLIATITTSFDATGSRASAIEVLGSQKSVAIEAGTDSFNSRLLCCKTYGKWETVDPIFTGWSDRWWGIGPVDMVNALESGVQPRASSNVARHVLEILLAMETSCADGNTVPIVSRCEPVESLSVGSIECNFPCFFRSSNTSSLRTQSA